MKVTMKYDQGVRAEEVVMLEIPDEEFAEMIENDYQQRLRVAAAGEVVLRRTPQAIIDEWNREELSCWRKHNRRSIPLLEESDEGSEMEIMNILTDRSWEKGRQRKEEYEEICQRIYQALKPKQAEMMIAICIESVSIKDYALKIGDEYNNVFRRFKRTKKLLKNQ